MEKRQRVVLKTAEHSSAIVSSLFPENVRDRAFPIQSTAVARRTSKHWKHDETKKRSIIESSKDAPVGPADQNNDDSLPVADLFHDCTVLFADIA